MPSDLIEQRYGPDMSGIGPPIGNGFQRFQFPTGVLPERFLFERFDPSCHQLFDRMLPSRQDVCGLFATHDVLDQAVDTDDAAVGEFTIGADEKG